MSNWRLLPLGIYNGYWNMAIDEAILNAVIQEKSENTIRFYRWSPSTASIGRNQSLSREIDMDFAERKGFQVVRRITGGGAVFHDKEGEITYSIICPIKILENLGAYKVLEQFEIITKGIIAGLRSYGIKPQKGVIHCPAIFLDGKKFSGNAQLRKKGYLLQHGTILLDIDPELMYSVLKAPPSVSKSRMVQSVRAKCIGIREKLEDGFNEEKLLKKLLRGFEQVLGITLEVGKLSKFEIELAENLVKEKYSNPDWLRKYE
ncbi:MAG: lipoate--protein ligase family protein [Promethearchaeota archaeon]|nr:MAG: lipoate--protein ligase family protein [Candidatus Lokiarchaeota archaeon]